MKLFVRYDIYTYICKIKLETMKTAKELFNKMLEENDECTSTEMMIEFAKLHVEAAKKEYHKVLVKQGIVTNAGIAYFDNAYPLELIK